MQWSERNILLEVLEHAGVDEDRPVVARPAMHHAVPDRDRHDVVALVQPGAGRRECRRHVGDLAAFVAFG